MLCEATCVKSRPEKTELQMWMALVPDILITAIALTPGGVANAQMLESSKKYVMQQNY